MDNGQELVMRWMEGHSNFSTVWGGLGYGTEHIQRCVMARCLDTVMARIPLVRDFNFNAIHSTYQLTVLLDPMLRETLSFLADPSYIVDNVKGPLSKALLESINAARTTQPSLEWLTGTTFKAPISGSVSVFENDNAHQKVLLAEVNFNGDMALSQHWFHSNTASLSLTFNLRLFHFDSLSASRVLGFNSVEFHHNLALCRKP